MKIILTGSLGNIKKPITNELVPKGHSITVISRRGNKQKAMEALSSEIAICSIKEVKFLTASFTSALEVNSVKQSSL